MQSPSLQKLSESSLKNDSYLQGWLPVLNDKEESIVSYLDSLGINQLTYVEKFNNQKKNYTSSTDNSSTPLSQKLVTINLDSELYQRRSFRLSSDQI